MENSFVCKLQNTNLEAIGYVVAIANINDKHDRSAPSHYHWKILKCRMIIFSNSAICACPDKKDLQQVHIIFNKVGDNYDKLNSLLLKFSLTQDGSIRKATPEIFQMCFQYSMLARIAPTWCLLGQSYLINHRDFLVEGGPKEGIHFQISSNENITTLELKPVKINLMISNEEVLPGEWIRVLPSLNKAIVEEFSEILPSGSFKSYKDLRRHWKNIHGYRLPEKEGPYYTIRFWRGEPLTYPKLCITRKFPIITPIPKSAQKGVLDRFLTCLRSKMPFVLGQPLVMYKSNYNEKRQIEALHEGKDQIVNSQAVSLCTPTQVSQIQPNQFVETKKIKLTQKR